MEKIEVRCSFCKGQGTDPFGILSWCSLCVVCGGKGLVQIIAPYVKCAHCDGSGAIKRFTCTVCDGTGFIHKPVNQTKVCPTCYGTGDDTSVAAMACLTCEGHGWIPQ